MRTINSFNFSITYFQITLNCENFSFSYQQIHVLITYLIIIKNVEKKSVL